MRLEAKNVGIARAAGRFIAVCGLATGLVAGSVSAADPGDNTVDQTYGDVEFIWEDGYLTIISADGSIIDWVDFNVAEGETVEFILPGMDARILNRIIGGAPSEILGNLLSNGQVYIANPAGVIFGDGAVVNVGALYAAAGNISNEDFIAGVNRFTDARGVVENRGHLEGELIALVGGRVANHGTISAPMGTVVLAAGEDVLIGEHLGNVFVQLNRETDRANTPLLSPTGDPAVNLAAGDMFSLAAWNTGAIDAGNVQFRASGGSKIVVSGEIDAHYGDVGGDVSIIGTAVRIFDADIDATGSEGGGSLYIEGINIKIDDRNGDSDIRAGKIDIDSFCGHEIDLGTDLHAADGAVTIYGPVRLVDDVSITATGNGAGINLFGNVFSKSGEFNDLLLDASDGTINIAEGLGGEGGDERLGSLDVFAGLARVGGDVLVRDEMNWYTPVAVYGESVTFHTGDGTALFANDIYSEVVGESEIAFLYDGNAFAGDGSARAPFKFRGNIGVASDGEVGGKFRTIRFGDDLETPSSSAGFVFANNAGEGNSLLSADGLDLGTLYRVSACDAIFMGRGQKMTSFGSLSMSAEGPGYTLVQLGDINVLGDLSVASRGEGGEIHLLGRDGSLVDSVDSEGDRENGTIDKGAEIIALGSVTMIGDVSVDGGTATIGGETVRIATNSGNGSIAGIDIEIFPEGVSLDLFRSLMDGNEGLIYPYDLFLTEPPIDPRRPEANLATSFMTDDPIVIRDDPALFAARDVLTELTLNPRDPSTEILHDGQSAGGARFDEAGAAAFGVTIDRLSPRTVDRLVGAYVGLFGERINPTEMERVRTPFVQDTLARLWTGSQGTGATSAFAYAAEHDLEGFGVLYEIQGVFDAISRLELTPLEIQRAEAAFLAMLQPDSLPEGTITREWLGSTAMADSAEGSDAGSQGADSNWIIDENGERHCKHCEAKCSGSSETELWTSDKNAAANASEDCEHGEDRCGEASDTGCERQSEKHECGGDRHTPRHHHDRHGH